MAVGSMGTVNVTKSAAEKRTNVLSACPTWRQKSSALSSGSVFWWITVCNLYIKSFSQHTFICLVTIPGWYSYQTNKGVLTEGFYVQVITTHRDEQLQTVCKPTRIYTSLQHALLLGCSTQALTTVVYQDGCLSTKIQKEHRSFLLSVTSVILLLRT